MKSVLKSLFNFLRNLSFLIVVALFMVGIWLVNDDQFMFDLTKRIQEKEYSGTIINREDDRTRKAKEIIALAEASEEEDELSIQRVDEVQFETPFLEKFSFKVKGGSAYLRPSQIMYIEAQEAKQIIHTTAGNDIVTQSKMKDILEALKEKGKFFSTKSHIVNCNYIQQVLKESTEYRSKYNYTCKIKFEDKSDVIDFPCGRKEELITMMESITF